MGISYSTYLKYITPYILFILPSFIAPLFAFLQSIQYKKRARFQDSILMLISSSLSFVFSIFIFIDYLTSSDANTALIFIFLPFYTIIIVFASFLIGRLIFKLFIKYSIQKPTTLNNYLFTIPLILLLITLILAFLSVKENVIYKIAETSDVQSDLTYLFNKAKDEKNEGVMLFLAQNPNTPSSILVPLDSISPTYVRYHIINNRNTPLFIIENISNTNHENLGNYAREKLVKRNKYVQ